MDGGSIPFPSWTFARTKRLPQPRTPMGRRSAADGRRGTSRGRRSHLGVSDVCRGVEPGMGGRAGARSNRSTAGRRVSAAGYCDGSALTSGERPVRQACTADRRSRRASFGARNRIHGVPSQLPIQLRMSQERHHREISKPPRLMQRDLRLRSDSWPRGFAIRRGRHDARQGRRHGSPESRGHRVSRATGTAGRIGRRCGASLACRCAHAGRFDGLVRPSSVQVAGNSTACDVGVRNRRSFHSKNNRRLRTRHRNEGLCKVFAPSR